MNQSEAGTTPLLASPQGGVAERITKHREASNQREAGVVFRFFYQRKITPVAPYRLLRNIFLMSQPPLLAVMQGGDYSAPVKFMHGVIDGRNCFRFADLSPIGHPKY
jgi:hypothetical protein